VPACPPVTLRRPGGIVLRSRSVLPAPEPPTISPRYGDTKTRKSRRSLALPARCVQVLNEQYKTQGYPDQGALVFASRAGTQLDRHNVLRAFRPIIKAAGVNPADWTPRELRHSFVSLLSD
jgi:integrase